MNTSALRLVGITAAAALTLSLSACGSSDKSSSSASTKAVYAGVKVNAAAKAKLPTKYASELNVAADIPYAPMEMYASDQKTVEGFDYDLGQALGKALGVKKVVFEKQAFDTIIASLKSHNHDIIMSSMTDTKERQQSLDFVDYFHAGASIIVKKGNPEKITGLTSLCGKTVAVEAATSEATMLKAYTPTCTAAGKKAITVNQLPQDTNAQAAVRAGRAVADVADSQVAAYVAKTAGDGKYFQLVEDPKNPNGYEAAYMGIGVLKSDTQLTQALTLALQAVMDDGTYAKILKKWGLSDFAVDKAGVNRATS